MQTHPSMAVVLTTKVKSSSNSRAPPAKSKEKPLVLIWTSPGPYGKSGMIRQFQRLVQRLN